MSSKWRLVLAVAAEEPIRNRVMLALAYDAALRREELCTLNTDDLDPGHRMLVKAENTKNRMEQVVPYSASTGVLRAPTDLLSSTRLLAGGLSAQSGRYRWRPWPLLTALRSSWSSAGWGATDHACHQHASVIAEAIQARTARSARGQLGWGLGAGARP